MTQSLLNTLPNAMTSPSASIYSQACYNHAITPTVLFDITKSNDGLSQNDALSYVLSNNSSKSPLKDIDNCTSFICGSGCLL
mmetsp:Transcript_49870/g.63888  ORF Transcript_49870/g.63888 Transcript_49870/m.63888 type:complete len:82 (+) Transcript_49870:540-785(+)